MYARNINALEHNMSADFMIGKTIQRIREFRKISYADLSNSLSWSHHALKAYEEGYLPISATALYMLCNALEIKIDDFYKVAFEQAH
jgi:transcriptional regulator with XRE-family HTH domain